MRQRGQAPSPPSLDQSEANWVQVMRGWCPFLGPKNRSLRRLILFDIRLYFTERIYQLVSESQLPDKIGNLFFTIMHCEKTPCHHRRLQSTGLSFEDQIHFLGGGSAFPLVLRVDGIPNPQSRN